MTTISQAITTIYEKHGSVTPSEVLKAAASPKSPLHGYFEWNDDVAAHEYRLAQARTLIRKVRIIVDGAPQRLIHIPIVVANPDGSREGHYKPISVVVSVQSDFQRARGELQKHMDAARRALDELLTAAATEGFEISEKLEVAKQALNVAREALVSAH